MSLDRHFGYLEEIELTIHPQELLPTVKLPPAFSIDEVFKGYPSFRFGWMTPFGPVPNTPFFNELAQFYALALALQLLMTLICPILVRISCRQTESALCC